MSCLKRPKNAMGSSLGLPHDPCDAWLSESPIKITYNQDTNVDKLVNDKWIIRIIKITYIYITYKNIL